MVRKDDFNQTHAQPGPEKPPLDAVSVGTGRLRVKLDLHFQGQDFLLRITGGKAHVGAVGVWDPRRPDEEAKIIELTGHREGPLAGECAGILGRATKKAVAAVVGIHQDQATREEITSIVENVRKGAAILAGRLSQGDG
jgi:hypothetical protein